MTTPEKENKSFARHWNEEIWGKQNLDEIDDLVAEDFVGYDPSQPEPVHGPDGIREVAEMLLGAFPRWVDVFVTGDLLLGYERPRRRGRGYRSRTHAGSR